MKPEATNRYWVSCRRFTIEVACDAAGTIVRAAPIARGFLGQPYARLLEWARRQGGLETARLDATEDRAGHASERRDACRC